MTRSIVKKFVVPLGVVFALVLAAPAGAAPDPASTTGCGTVAALEVARVAGQPLDPASITSAAQFLAGSGTAGAKKVARVLGKAKTPKQQAAAVKAAAKACTKKIAPAPLFTQAGSGTATTASFRVPQNWDMSWHYDCSSFALGQGNFIVSIYDADAEGGPALDLDNQGVNQLGPSGLGVDHYHSGGNLKYLQITSECNWDITITKP